MSQATHLSKVLAIAALAAFGICSAPPSAVGSQKNGKTKSFAQMLVEQTQAKHPEADEIGISVSSSHGCRTIASTDAGDIGEACEKEDSEPMRTGKPYVEKEKDGFDLSVPPWEDGWSR
jgi:hypothetical protein